MSFRSSVERPDHSLCACDAPGAARRSWLGRSLIWLLSLPIWLYRYGISPFVAPRCRFMPSCSEYALDALARHGPLVGTRLALGRIARCHPWGGFGYDPVPEPDDTDPTEPRISASR